MTLQSVLWTMRSYPYIIHPCYYYQNPFSSLIHWDDVIDLLKFSICRNVEQINKFLVMTCLLLSSITEEWKKPIESLAVISSHFSCICKTKWIHLTYLLFFNCKLMKIKECIIKDNKRERQKQSAKRFITLFNAFCKSFE